MLVSLRKNGLTSLFKEVRVFKVISTMAILQPVKDIFEKRAATEEVDHIYLSFPRFSFFGAVRVAAVP